MQQLKANAFNFPQTLQESQLSDPRYSWTGKYMLIAGVALFIYARMFMQTTVSTGFGDVYNIGLLQERHTTTIIALVLIVVGGVNNKPNRGSKQSHQPRALENNSRSTTEPKSDFRSIAETPEKMAKRRTSLYRLFAAAAFAVLIGLPLSALLASVLSAIAILALGTNLLDDAILFAMPFAFACLIGTTVFAFKRCSNNARILQTLNWIACSLLVIALYIAAELFDEFNFSMLLKTALVTFMALGVLYMREHLKEHPLIFIDHADL